MLTIVAIDSAIGVVAECRVVYPQVPTAPKSSSVGTGTIDRAIYYVNVILLAHQTSVIILQSQVFQTSSFARLNDSNSSKRQPSWASEEAAFRRVGLQ